MRNRTRISIPAVIILILSTAFVLRNYHLTIWPRKGATFDEYAWTWQGMSLINTGVPVSWSPHSQYKNKKLVIYQDTAFWLAKPYLEHPPLFGLIAGGFAILRGAKSMFDINIGTIRPLALILGIASVWLLYLYISQIYGRSVGSIAALLYAIVPTVVVGSRLVQNENFFIPIWLAALYVTSRFLKTGKTYLCTLAAILCGLLALAKVPWLAATLSIVLIFLYNKRYRDLMSFVTIALSIFALYFLYGLWYDRVLFINLWKLQIARYDFTFSSIFSLWTKPYLTDRYYLDGWIYVGWGSLIILIGNNFRKHYWILIPLLSYFLIYLAGIPDEPGHGWYRYPFYPFLITSIAVVGKEYFARNWMLTFFGLTFVLMSLLQTTWGTVFGFSYIVLRLAIISCIAVLLPIFFRRKTVNSASFSVSFLLLIFIIILTVWSVILYNEQ